MMAEEPISLVVGLLVIARAVNILKEPRRAAACRRVDEEMDAQDQDPHREQDHDPREAFDGEEEHDRHHPSEHGEPSWEDAEADARSSWSRS